MGTSYLFREPKDLLLVYRSGGGGRLKERTLRALTQANGLDFILQVSERR